MLTVASRRPTHGPAYKDDIHQVNSLYVFFSVGSPFPFLTPQLVFIRDSACRKISFFVSLLSSSPSSCLVPFLSCHLLVLCLVQRCSLSYLPSSSLSHVSPPCLVLFIVPSLVIWLPRLICRAISLSLICCLISSVSKNCLQQTLSEGLYVFVKLCSWCNMHQVSANYTHQNTRYDPWAEVWAKLKLKIIQQIIIVQVICKAQECYLWCIICLCQPLKSLHQ